MTKSSQNLTKYVGESIIKTDNQRVREWYCANVSTIPIESKIRRKNMTREEALKDILETASKTNADVNKEFGL